MENIIGLWINVSRAYEVAKVGGHSLQIIYADDYVEAADDYELIKEFYSDVSFKATGELIVEITKPNYIQKGTFETLEIINGRVEKALKNRKPKEFKNSACDMLLKTAIERLSLSLKQLKQVKKVAGTIAQIDGANTIGAEHVAEAIHYSCYISNEQQGIIAESNTLFFGKDIKIIKGHIEQDVAKKAVVYLSKYL